MDLSDLSFIASPAAPRARAVGAASAGRVLVLCDGELAAGESLVQTLRRVKFTVSAHRPTRADTEVAAGTCDVVVIDAQSSSDCIIEWIASIRRSYSSSELPILVLGTQARVGQSCSAFDAGANDWMARPIDASELTRRMNNLVELSRLRRLQTGEETRIRQELSTRTERLDALIETGLMMSMERDRSKLLRQLLTEGRRILNCDGATMYMVTEEKTLRFEMRTLDDALPSMQIPLYDAVSGRPNENYVSAYTAIHNRSVLIDDVYSETRFDLSGTRAFDASSGYRTVSMLTVPIAPRGGEAIGVLQFMNAKHRDSARIVPFERDTVSLVEALAAQAAVALDNLGLVESQKQLMESLIRVLATAIDAKSPYTGRHCERVPELAFLLAEAACKATDGPLADFAFRNEEEWQEFRIGAWLHDCGKVTTPEYVIDKATKLETINNRIHEVRTRFEVLLRDIEIERLQAQLSGTLGDELAASLGERRQRLHDDFAFVAACNLGSEAMETADEERLAAIAKTPWTRHFDDRLGLSQGELARLIDEPTTPLPAVEHLLSDRPRDLVARGADDGLVPEFDFKMDVPEHLYNHGEVYNLSIRRGTLTREERYKINEHMVHTIMMLERMPFPKHLRRVPEYAGTHHERIDGKGYPRRLSGAELSVPSRIMAVADIFEALTASDRPYKKPKKLSEALRVLQGMAGDHIDADIYDLFITAGVFRDFAAKHLSAEQIDVTDGTPYLSRPARG
jgi:HD-GYP domain-containing protein (c-di-GMP phosphodiesterase class II)/DNA-binding response OmpR family regulator